MVSVFIKKLLDGIYESCICIWHEHTRVYDTVLQNLFGYDASEFGKKNAFIFLPNKNSYINDI